jgi:hypothetical protein
MEHTMKTKTFFKSIFLLPVIFIVACSALIATPTPSEMDVLETALAQMNAINTANPDGHLHEIMKEQGVSLTAKEVQYDMVNNLDKEFGLSGNAEMCDYYNWGYDDSIKDRYFCVEVTPSGGYSERWYIYFSRENATELYQDLLQGSVQIFLTAKIQSNLYDKNQGNMATGLYAEWYK